MFVTSFIYPMLANPKLIYESFQSQHISLSSLRANYKQKCFIKLSLVSLIKLALVVTPILPPIIIFVKLFFSSHSTWIYKTVACKLNILQSSLCPHSRSLIDNFRGVVYNCKMTIKSTNMITIMFMVHTTAFTISRFIILRP